MGAIAETVVWSRDRQGHRTIYFVRAAYCRLRSASMDNMGLINRMKTCFVAKWPAGTSRASSSSDRLLRS